MSKINLKELANGLGLSQTTVSRALNDYPEVREATRQRVKEAAEKHGYRPNARAKGLATGRVMAIGHVIPISEKLDMVNPIFGDFLAGASEIYSQSGYQAVISVVTPDREEETYRSMRSTGSVDGVVIHGPKMDDPRIPLLEELGLPFVIHGRASGHGAPYPWVDVNNRAAFFRATSHLLDLGHERIGLVNGPEHMDFAYRRRQGFESALAERGLSPIPSVMVADEMTEAFGYRAASQMLDQENPPTALVVSSIISAFGVRRAIQDRGMQLGKDFSVITFDDELSYLKNDGEIPVFTTCRSCVKNAGKRAAELLIKAINDPELPPETVLMEAELTIGQSTGPLRR